MYKYDKATTTTMERNTSYQGETIEQKVNRITNNKEPIKDGAPQIYTNRKDGVQAAYDIRTDRFEIAVDAMDKVNKSHKAKREERHKTIEEKQAEEKATTDGKPDTTQTTDTQQQK